jgi:hypothetical protein
MHHLWLDNADARIVFDEFSRCANVHPFFLSTLFLTSLSMVLQVGSWLPLGGLL